MFSIGNEELEGQPVAVEGMDTKCPHCGQMHPVIFAKNADTGKKTSKLGAVKCTNGSMYLVVVSGRILPGKEPDR